MNTTAQTATTKKEQLLQAALALFAENGYPATHVRDITESCGMGKSTFYDYFKSKEEVLLEIFQSKIVDSYENFASYLDGSSLCCKEKLKALFHFESEMAALMGAPKNHMQMLCAGNDFLKNEQICDAIHRFILCRFSLISRILEEGSKNGEFREADRFRATAFIMGAFLFSCHLNQKIPLFPPEFAASIAPLSQEEHEEEVLELIFKGLEK